MTEKKIKYIIITLVVVVVMSVLLTLHIDMLLKTLKQEKENLVGENEALAKKIEELRENVSSFKSSVEKITREKEEIQKQRGQFQSRFGQISKQFEKVSIKHYKLMEKLKQKPEEAKEEAKKEDAALDSDDYFGQIEESKKQQLEEALNDTHSGLTAQKVDVERLEREKGVLELELNNVIRDKKELDQRFNYMAFELLKEKNLSLIVQDNLKAVKNENLDLKKQLRALSKEKTSIERQLAKTKQEKLIFDRRFNEMSVLLEKRLSEIEGLKQQVTIAKSTEQVQLPKSDKETVELAPIVVRQEGDTAESQIKKEELPRIGKILALNSENNFVIINLGEESGIKLGDVFKVYRKGTIEPIADIEVIQVRKKISACNIKKKSIALKPEDTVK